MRRTLALSALLLLAPSASFAVPASPLRPTVIAGTTEPVLNLVRTGADGAEWALPGGSSLIASPGTELRVIGKPQTLDLGPRGKVPSFTVLLKQGLVRARVPAHATSAIVIAAPKRTSVLVASGETSVVAGHQLAAANVSGSASFATEGKALRPLEAGMVEVLDGSGGRRALLASPKSVSGALVLLSTGAKVGLGEFGWEAVPGAVAYRAELREVASDRLEVRKETQTPALVAGSVDLAPGVYRLRVVSLDSSGMESARPLERSLHVVRVTLPAGGYFDGNGSLRIPSGSGVGFANAEGVEFANGLGDRFVQTPPTLALSGAEPRLVRLRAPGEGDGQSLWLLPRRARAHIEFAPRTPRWPEQPLEIRVRIEDEQGVAAGWVEARPKVSVGVDVVNVPFAVDGAWLKGTLPARAGKGPWVVRVEVSDQHGIDLGRDFIEVATR